MSLGLSILELARISKVSKSRILTLEGARKVHLPPPGPLDSLARALGLSPRALLEVAGYQIDFDQQNAAGAPTSAADRAEVRDVGANSAS